VDEEKGEARVVDYKLGKSRYADVGQLELMALKVPVWLKSLVLLIRWILLL
jgi:hypothetical protein